jgi:hypothetical protein
MADAFADSVAIALALGISEKEYREIYEENVDKLNKIRKGTPLVEAIGEYMNGPISGKRSVEGKAESLVEKIIANYSGNKEEIPGSASHFTRQADNEFDNLKDAGWRVNVDDTGSKGTVIKIIRRRR